MKAGYRIVTLFAVSSCLLRADMKLTIRTTPSAGPTHESTEYYKGHLIRRDFATGYQVVDFSTGRSFSVDSAKKEYYPFDGARLAMKQVVDPARKVFTETTCSATGEQRQFFGYTAYHYLTAKKFHDEVNGQPSGIRETHADAWIVDLPVPPHVQGIASPNANFLVTAGVAGGVMKVPEVHSTHSGPRPRGLVVRLHSEQYESEVVAFSQAPLDENLFEAPKGFREVASVALAAQPRSAGPWLRFCAWLDGLLGT